MCTHGRRNSIQILPDWRIIFTGSTANHKKNSQDRQCGLPVLAIFCDLNTVARSVVANILVQFLECFRYRVIIS